MFVPVEGIGSIIAKIVGATRLPLETLEFFEDKCVVTFSTRAQAKATLRNSKPSGTFKAPIDTNVKFTLPPGPWKKTKTPGVWECDGEKRAVKELAADRGIKPSVMSQRLLANGMLDTQKRRSMFEKIAKRERLSLA